MLKSFADGLEDTKSTTGAVLCLVGPRAFVNLGWVCRKQGAVSHSPIESEVISLESSLRLEGLPALLVWDVILKTLNPKVRGDADKARGDPCAARFQTPRGKGKKNGQALAVQRS